MPKSRKRRHRASNQRKAPVKGLLKIAMLGLLITVIGAFIVSVFQPYLVP